MEKPKNQAKRRNARFVSQRIQFNGFNGLQCESCPINCVVWFRLIQMHRSKWDVPERFADKLWEELKFCWPQFAICTTKNSIKEWRCDLKVHCCNEAAANWFIIHFLCISGILPGPLIFSLADRPVLNCFPSFDSYSKQIFKSLLLRGVAAGRAGRAIALPIFWQETAVTVTS